MIFSNLCLEFVDIQWLVELWCIFYWIMYGSKLQIIANFGCKTFIFRTFITVLMMIKFLFYHGQIMHHAQYVHGAKFDHDKTRIKTVNWFVTSDQKWFLFQDSLVWFAGGYWPYGESQGPIAVVPDWPSAHGPAWNLDKLLTKFKHTWNDKIVALHVPGVCDF